MDIKEVVNLIIEDFYYNGMDGYDEDSGIVLDQDNFRLMQHLHEADHVKTFSEYVSLVNSYYKQMSLKGTEISSSKETIHIKYPIGPNLNKLSIFIAALPQGSFLKEFGISVEQMKNVLESILLRQIVNLNVALDHRIDVIDDYRRILGVPSNSFWFNVEDIVNICPSVPRDNIVNLLKFVSVDIIKHDVDDDTQFLIYQADGEYVLPYYSEFCNALFSFIEKKIISNLTGLGTTQSKYSHLRGEYFEEMTYQMLTSTMRNHNIHSNVQYVDLEEKKRESDALVQKDDLIINFECKSSAFNIFDLETDESIKRKYKNAFGRTFDSIKALHDLQKSGNRVQIYNGRIGRSTCIFDQSLKHHTLIHIQVSLSSIEYIGTNIQYFDAKFAKYEIQPIVLSYADLFIICYCYAQRPEMVLQYFRERQDYLNKKKKVRLDIDEIDTFGMLTDKRNRKMKEYMDTGNGELDMTFMIGNGAYRETFTRWMDNNTIGEMIENQPKHLRDSYYRLLEVR